MEGSLYALHKGKWEVALDGSRLLAGIGNEIWRLDGSIWVLHSSLSQNFGNITVIHPNPGDRLLVGGKNGLALVDGNGTLITRDLEGVEISDLFESGGRLWVAMWRNGIATRDGDRWVTAGMEHGLPGKSLLGLVVDTAGNLWMGYSDAGIVRVGVTEMLGVMTPVIIDP